MGHVHRLRRGSRLIGVAGLSLAALPAGAIVQVLAAKVGSALQARFVWAG